MTKKGEKRGVYKQEEVKNLADVFEKKACNISATCASLGITRQTFYNWLERFPEIAQKVEDAREGLVDFAETQLISKINDGDLNAITFFLRAKGKERGYGDSKKIEFDGAGERIVYISKEMEKATQDHIDQIIESKND